MKSYLLAFDCSFHVAGVALLDLEKLALFNPNIENKKKLTPFLQEFHHKDFKFPIKELKKQDDLIEQTWDSSSGPHSDQLALKIAQALSFGKKDTPLKQEEIYLQLKKHLLAVAVGTGPGRFTGIRTALSFAKSLAYALKIPICPINSLQILAESFFEEKPSEFKDNLSGLENKNSELKDKTSDPENKASEFSKKISPVYVSLQAFKNQVYHGEFTPFHLSKVSSTSKTATPFLKKNLFWDISQVPTINSDTKERSLSLLDFKDWEEKILNSSEKKIFCISDLESFYKIKTPVLNKLYMQTPKISPGRIALLALKQGHWIQDWKKIQANYMRSNF